MSVEIIFYAIFALFGALLGLGLLKGGRQKKPSLVQPDVFEPVNTARAEMDRAAAARRAATRERTDRELEEVEEAHSAEDPTTAAADLLSRRSSR